MTQIDETLHVQLAVDESGRGTDEFTHVVQELFQQQQLDTIGVYEGSLGEDAADGIYLSPERADGEELPKIVHMRLLSDEFRLGSAASHHEVFFGSVLVEREGEAISAMNVAVKPFTTAMNATREHDALTRVAAKGLDTLEPLALVKAGDRTTLITRKREDLLTRDNVKWTIPFEKTGPDGYEEVVVPELRFIAESMAEMHSKGVFHGDAQPKNFALSDTGRNVVIDLEDAIISENDEETVGLFTGWGSLETGFAYGDIVHCWRALTNPMAGDNIQEGVPPNTLLIESPGEVVLDQFERNYLIPYLEKLEELMPEEVYSQIDVKRLAVMLRNQAGCDLIPGFVPEEL
jgi:hypothetical protein